MESYQPIRLYTLSILIVLYGMLFATARLTMGDVSAETRPHLPRVNPNLMPNPTILSPETLECVMSNGAKGCYNPDQVCVKNSAKSCYNWFTEGNANYDGDTNRSGNSGSMKFSEGCKQGSPDTHCVIKSPLVKVEPGKVYTAAAYLKSTNWPPPIVKFFYLPYVDNEPENEDGVPTYTPPIKGGSRQVPINTTDWSEAVEFFIPEPGIDYVRLSFGIVEQQVACNPEDPSYPNDPCDSGPVWVDDVYFGQGVGFAEAPAIKTEFSGDRVRVDTLGNMELWRDGEWQPFFPMIIYPANKDRDVDQCCQNAGRECEADDYDWAKYRAHGFNTVNQVNSFVDSLTEDRAEKALQADLMISFTLDGYIANPTHPIYNDTTHLRDTIDLLASIPDEMHGSTLDRVVIYNWDTEANIEAWGVAKNVTDKVRSFDPHAPIYALMGNEGLARLYSSESDQLIDVVGAYVRGGENSIGRADAIPEDLLILDRLEGQRSPVLIAQINPQGYTSGGELRTRIYKGIITGARGLSIYADCRLGTKPPLPLIKDAAWSPELRDHLSDEINLLLPIIREPHWTEWRLDVEPGSSLVWGTRDHAGYGYAILANMSATETATAKLTPMGLGDGHRLLAARDFFSGDEVSVVDGSFKVSLAPQTTAVYQLTFTAELVAAYPFNGNAKDASPNKYDGVVDGAELTYDRFGKPKNAYLFLNSDPQLTTDAIRVPAFPNLNTFTIAVWFKYTTPLRDGSVRPIVAKEEWGTSPLCPGTGQCFTAGFGLQLKEIDDGKPILRVQIHDESSGNTVVAYNNELLEQDTWYFGIATYDGTTLKTYLNCNVGTITNNTGSITPATSDLQIGHRDFPISDILPHFVGSIDDIQIYDQALEVQSTCIKDFSNLHYSILTCNQLGQLATESCCVEEPKSECFGLGTAYDNAGCGIFADLCN